MKNNKTDFKELQMILCKKFEIFNILRTLNFRTLCYRANISKKQGVEPVLITTALFLMSFLGKSVNHFVTYCKTAWFQELRKDVLYRLASDSKINWRRFLYELTLRIITKIKSYKSWSKRFYIIDTTNIVRSGKKSEYLSWNYDSCKKRTEKGYQVTLLGLCDMNSFLPVDFCITSSTNKICGENISVDKRSCGGIRRKENNKKKTELSLEMLFRAVNRYNLEARTVLLDSWFCNAGLIGNIIEQTGLDIISKMKISPKISVNYKGKRYSTRGLCEKVFKSIRQKEIVLKGENFIVSSAICIYGNTPVKIVFCMPAKSSKTKKPILILSTDLKHSEKEIIESYSVRWAIEVMFKQGKEKFNLNVKYLRNFESIVCFTTLSFARYLLITYLDRKKNDHRTIGTLFENLKSEIEELNILSSLEMFLSEFLKKISKCLSINLNFIDKISELFDSIALSIENMLFLRCET